MNGNEKLAVLIREIEQGMSVLAKLETFMTDFMRKEYQMLGRTPPAAIIIADTITNYYTCSETVFLRISRFFENALQNERWHSDLLYKMTLDIDGVRPAVISEQTHALLVELMRFRHFKRYYFDFDYDWDRMDFLLKKYDQVKQYLTTDLENFSNFLRQVMKSSDSD